jgi:hypothetical protein
MPVTLHAINAHSSSCLGHVALLTVLTTGQTACTLPFKALDQCRVKLPEACTTRGASCCLHTNGLHVKHVIFFFCLVLLANTLTVCTLLSSPTA